MLALCLWVMLTGAHLDVLQLVAWARMLSDNASSMGVGAALDQTFSEEGMCSLCHAIAEERQEEQRPDLPAPEHTGKALLYLPQATRIAVYPPQPSGCPVARNHPALLAVSCAPPTPPPRSVTMV